MGCQNVFILILLGDLEDMRIIRRYLVIDFVFLTLYPVYSTSIYMNVDDACTIVKPILSQSQCLVSSLVA